MGGSYQLEVSKRNVDNLTGCIFAEKCNSRENNSGAVFLFRILRGTMRTFLFLSRLSALWPAAQSPIVKRGVWFVMSYLIKNKIDILATGQKFAKNIYFCLKNKRKNISTNILCMLVIDCQYPH